ncbi:hypothetical protein [Helicobacter sp.]|uniref:hypothetical protein n=1 Tax=Helicobacter sp. TaxID=218 RepID=UPI0025C3615B|nr:hypothetical protein [Helicobacter sp.]
MSDKELEIFELCERLTELLGDKEAIADLKALWKRHPEMFKDMQEVSQTIKKVVSKAEIITEAKRKDATLVATMLEDNHKMGEVAIENDEGTNIIFHTNKKRAKEFERLKSLLVETPTPSTHHSKLAGELMGKNPSGANAHSANFDEIIPQTNENQSIVEQIKAESKDFNTLSSNEKLALLEKNQQALSNMQSTKDLQQQRNDSMDLQQEKELQDSKNQEFQIGIRKNRR